MSTNILLFYKFVNIADAQKFAAQHLEFCKELGVKGKVLVAKEGINGSVSGTFEQTEKYKESLRADDRFSDIVFKEEQGLTHPFKGMFVRVKKEIIRLDKEVDMNKRAKYISPKEFLEMYKKGEDKDVIILDARNDYESRVGKFKNAVTPGIKNFRDFPEVVESLKNKKDAKIVTYCTGGIRCEKASAYMVEQGFTDVSQLEGGIITFAQQFPNTVWEGKCFVFDKRMFSDINAEGKPLTQCENCGTQCDLYKNCANVKCNLLMVQCISCDEKMQGCCSKDCMLKRMQTLQGQLLKV